MNPYQYLANATVFHTVPKFAVLVKTFLASVSNPSRPNGAVFAVR